MKDLTYYPSYRWFRNMYAHTSGVRVDYPSYRWFRNDLQNKKDEYYNYPSYRWFRKYQSLLN